MVGLFGFLASGAGRWVRALAGIVLILVGLFAIGGTAGYVVAIIGLVPLLAGALDYCVFAPLGGFSLKGSTLRAEVQRRASGK